MPLIQEYLVEARIELAIYTDDGKRIIEQVSVSHSGKASSYLGTSLQLRSELLIRDLKDKVLRHVAVTADNEIKRLERHAD